MIWYKLSQNNYNLTDGVNKTVISGLSAGDHEIVVSYAGDANYTADETVKPIHVDQAAPSMEITVPANVTPNTDVTVTVNIGNNATGKVNIIINGEDHIVNVTDGVATYIIPKDKVQPGNYTVAAEYYGDANYTASSNATGVNFTVVKYNTTVVPTYVVDKNNNVTVTVKVNDTASGTVTINGKTETIVNGEATINLGVLEQKDEPYTFDVIYSGDPNFNANTSSVSISVGKLDNANIDVQVVEAEYGKNTAITVTVPKDGEGNVTIYIDGYDPIVRTPDANGVVVVNVTPSVGLHQVNVTYTNSSRYTNK